VENLTDEVAITRQEIDISAKGWLSNRDQMGFYRKRSSAWKVA